MSSGPLSFDLLQIREGLSWVSTPREIVAVQPVRNILCGNVRKSLVFKTGGSLREL